ncbi:hypothetical protein ACFVHI_11915 [Kitasatospora sp. NPDC127121]|uniref:hypothetical protein n=1 Tax=Kitasatospora sp. NPDC127121 TaxID=3345371 RepID=UPI00363D52E7
MVVLGMLIPVVLGLALVANFRGIRDFFVEGAEKKSIPVIALIVGWFFIVVPGAAVLGMAVKAILR